MIDPFSVFAVGIVAIGAAGLCIIIHYQAQHIRTLEDAWKAADDGRKWWCNQFFDSRRQIELRDQLDRSLLNRRRLRAKRSDAALAGWETRRENAG